jgi:hypothetical protein
MALPLWDFIGDMGVSIVMVVPPARWMVYYGKYLLSMDENWGYPYFRKLYINEDIMEYA